MELGGIVSGLGVRTEVCTNRRAVIDGCDGIINYTNEEIAVKSGRLKITVTGRDLRLTILTDSAAVIEGVIKKVEFGY